MRFWRKNKMDIKIGQNGSEVVFRAGYLNRAARRKRAKLLKRKGCVR